MLREHYEKYGWIRTIILKSRRVGMSSYIDALAFVHCLARSQAHAYIVAHLKDVSQKGLFRVPRDLGVELNKKIGGIDVRASQIRFTHGDGDSVLDIATAGSVGGGRGLTLTFLHLSECAQYPGGDSFLSILPAVSKAPDTAIALESTAFGRVGIGQTFYEFWNRANLRGAKWNGYTPIFLSWLDDPACIREVPAEGAPASDLERELMAKPFHCTRNQIAWMRMVLEGECDSSEAKFSQEYPWTPEVAFIATGDPAFTPKEIQYAIGTKKPPLKRGTLNRTGAASFLFEENRQGKLLIWETPTPKCWYYVGVDCARGIESGDFAAYVVLNGTTGRIAARFQDLIDPVRMAEDVDKVGRWYNNALIIVELTGNLGLWCNKILRDQYMYPNLYVWKGKDDKMPGKSKGIAQGWETTSRTRDLMFSTFRGKLSDGMKNIPGGLVVQDEEIVRQMDLATVGQGLRWEVEYGHDDVLMATLLACVACSQYPPPNILSFTGNVLAQEPNSAVGKLKAQPELSNMLRQDLAAILRTPNKRTRSIIGSI